MPRVPELRTNFSAGELSDLVSGRTDYGNFYNGSITLENFVVLVQGVIFRRKGFRFIAETKDSTKKSRLIKFEFSTTQAYAIEVGEGYMRFFANQGRILENTTTISGATKANPVVITDTAHPYSNGDLIVIKDVVGMVELNDKEYIVANKTTNTYELQGVDGTAYTTYSSGGTAAKVHEISNPYLESELFQIKAHNQDNDIIYFEHPNHPLKKLTRTAANAFTFTDVELIKGPYIEQNIVSTDLVALTTGGGWTEGTTLTLTASGGHTPFTADHVGGLWKVTSGADIAHLKITGFTSSTIVTVVAKNDVPVSLQSGTHFTWSEGEFSAARSYPNAISFHEQRLVLAGSVNAPKRIWFSKSGDYEDFEEGTEDNDSFTVKIASTKGDPIQWLSSDEVLFVGTSEGIFRITHSPNSAAINVSDIDIKKHISYGSANIQPELVGSFPVYVQNGDNKVSSIGQSVKNNKYQAADLTVGNPEIVDSGIVEIGYQQSPISSLWVIRSDGEIARLISEENEEVLAWTRYTTQGLFESEAIISSSTNDEIYAIVNRTINGTVKRYVEAHSPNYLVDNLNGFFVDSGLTYNGTGTTNLTLDSESGSFAILSEDGKLMVTEDDFVLMTELFSINLESDAAIFLASDVGKEIHELNTGTGRALITAFVDSTNVTISIIEPFSTASLTVGNWAFAVKTVTGLDHLIGETVSICSDGSTVPDQVVSSDGEVTIDSAGSIIHVGLPYTSKQKNMPLEATILQGAIGTSQHKIKRVHSATITFKNTRGGQIITNNATVDINARGSSDFMNKTPDLFTGDREVTLAAGYDNLGQIELRQSEPQPIMVKSITYKMTVNDK